MLLNILDQLRTTELAGNTFYEWLIALIVALAIYFILWFAFGVLRRRILLISRKTKMLADDLLAAALEGTKHYCLAMVALWGGSQWVDLGSGEARLSFLLFIAVVVQLAIWVNRALSAYISNYQEVRKEENPGGVSIVERLSFLFRLLIWSVALLLVVDNLGYDITALVAGLGISGIAVALAVQNILGDLFASLSIVLDKPFVIGDFIIVGDLMGVVERVGLKTTRVRSLSGEQLIFSNSDLLNSRVRNFKRMEERRVPFAFGVLYQTSPEDLELIPELIREIIEGIDNTRFDRAHFKGFGASSYDFEVVYYVHTPDYNVFMDIQQQINLAICRGFAARGIEFAYPTRTLYINQAPGAE